MKGSSIILILMCFLATFSWAEETKPHSRTENPKEAKKQGRISSKTATTQPFGKAMITFRSARDGNWEIYVMNADGTAVRRLTKSPAREDMPRWSPDGKFITFRSERDGNQEIYVMNSDGSHQRRLTNHPAKDSNPCFSPDGSRILFASKRSGGWELYTMKPDGTDQRRLTHKKLDSGGGRYSPDGKRITFISAKDGNFEVYVMDSDGSNVKRLTRNPAGETGPIFSPSGRQIMFTSTRDGNYEVYLVNVDGTSLRNVTKNRANDAGCGFLDENNIVFVSDRTGDIEIHRMNLATGKVTQLTKSPGPDTLADVWVPPPKRHSRSRRIPGQPEDAQGEVIAGSAPIEVVRSSELKRKYQVVADVQALGTADMEKAVLDALKDMAHKYRGDALLDVTKAPSPKGKGEFIWRARVIVWTP